MTSSNGQVMASGDHGSSSTVPVISAISEPGLRNDTPAHTPSPPRPAPKDMREPLAQPPLHAARRHQDQLLGERVGQRVGQQGTAARRPADRCARHGGDEAPSRATIERRTDVSCAAGNEHAQCQPRAPPQPPT